MSNKNKRLQIFKHYKNHFENLKRNYQRKKPHSNNALEIVPKLLIAIDYYAVAQYFYKKNLPYNSRSDIKVMTHCFLSHHNFKIKNKLYEINWSKTLYYLNQVVSGLYPEVLIEFDKKQAHAMTKKKYQSKLYHQLIHDLLRVNNKKGSTGKLVIRMVKRLKRLVNLKGQKALSVNFHLNLEQIKHQTREYTRKHLKINKHSKLWGTTINHLYNDNVAQSINKHFSNHQAYVIILKMMCNAGVGIKF